METHITPLEEEFYEVFHLNNFGNLTDGQMYSKKELPEKLLSFISYREEKAREEGRKEERERLAVEVDEKLREILAKELPILQEKTITQYKEELLSKLPKEVDIVYETPTLDLSADLDTLKRMSKASGFNKCLSLIKELLN